MKELEYLYIGLTIAWLGIFAYIVYLHRKHIMLRKKLEDIVTMVKENEKKE